MASDFPNYEFNEGVSYAIEIEEAADAVKVEHHGEGAPEARTSYEALEYLGPVGSGPWSFSDWGSETDLTINARLITGVERVTER